MSERGGSWKGMGVGKKEMGAKGRDRREARAGLMESKRSIAVKRGRIDVKRGRIWS